MKERLVLKYTILLRPVPMYTTYRESEFVWTLRLFACQGVEIYSLVDYYDQKKLLWHVCWSGGWINQKYDQLSRQLDWAELGNILPFSMNSIKYIIVFRKTPNTALRFMLQIKSIYKQESRIDFRAVPNVGQKCYSFEVT